MQILVSESNGGEGTNDRLQKASVLPMWFLVQDEDIEVMLELEVFLFCPGQLLMQNGSNTFFSYLFDLLLLIFCILYYLTFLYCV